MKKFQLVSAITCAVVGIAASAATAGTPLMVTGAGSSSGYGHVVVNARATGPATGEFFPVAPAVGFLRAPEVPGFPDGTRDLSGKVTCIGLWPGVDAVAVSGNLGTPVVQNGLVYPNFTFLLWSSATGRNAIQVWADRLLPFSPCGTDLFFSAGQEDPEVIALSRLLQGHFNIMRTS
jgi:hypothetical protein